MNLFTAILPRFAILSGGILKGLRDFLIDSMEDLYEGSINLFMKFSSFKDILNQSYGIMPEFVRNPSGRWEIEPGLISDVLKIGQSFGAALALIFMVAAMIDIYTQEKMSVETFAKPFLQYLITVALMLNTEKIIALFWNFGVLFETEMVKFGAEGGFAQNIAVDFSEDASVGAIIGCFIGGIIMLLLCLVLGLIVRLCAYIANFTRVIEAALRAVGLPIALGVATDSNFRQGALRYIKKFFAVSLQGGMFAVISLLYIAVSVNVLTGTATKISQAADVTPNISETVGPLFDAETGMLISSVTEEAEAAIAMTVDAAALAAGVGAVLGQILMTIIPIIGLALACVVLLFKSGQICSDIVGA